MSLPPKESSGVAGDDCVAVTFGRGDGCGDCCGDSSGGGVSAPSCSEAICASKKAPSSGEGVETTSVAFEIRGGAVGLAIDAK